VTAARQDTLIKGGKGVRLVLQGKQEHDCCKNSPNIKGCQTFRKNEGKGNWGGKSSGGKKVILGTSEKSQNRRLGLCRKSTWGRTVLGERWLAYLAEAVYLTQRFSTRESRSCRETSLKVPSGEKGRAEDEKTVFGEDCRSTSSKRGVAKATHGEDSYGQKDCYRGAFLRMFATGDSEKPSSRGKTRRPYNSAEGSSRRKKQYEVERFLGTLSGKRKKKYMKGRRVDHLLSRRPPETQILPANKDMRLKIHIYYGNRC